MMQKFKPLLWAFLGAGFVFVLGLSAGLKSRSEVSHSTTMHADYPVYSDVFQLAESSDLVALVRVEKRLESRHLLPAELDESLLSPEEAAAWGPAVTDTLVTVSDVLYGDKEIVGESIILTETGGVIDDMIYDDPSQPLSRPGEEYLVFLEKHEDETHTILGGNQGKYRIQDSILRSVSKAPDSDLPVVQDLDGFNLNELQNLLKD